MDLAKEKQKLYNREYNKKNKEKNKIKKAVLYLKYTDKIKEKSSKRFGDIISHAVESLNKNTIINPDKWRYYCNHIRLHAKQNNQPYSEDFTNDMIFEMLAKRCYYCQSAANTIDRVDSSIGHIPNNCVGSCWPCNNSKGNGDIDSFLRKAFYRFYGKYYDNDEDIWSDNVIQPGFCKSQRSALGKKVAFSLTREQWDMLTMSDCTYCHRHRPTEKWNGVDRIIPADGYTLKNTTPCCDDCNVDKGQLSVEEMFTRNGKIAKRLRDKEIILIGSDKVFRNRGIRPNANKVCVRGKLYSSVGTASSVIGENIRNCLRRVKTPSDIFIVTDKFYEEYKGREGIDWEMFIGFEILYNCQL